MKKKTLIIFILDAYFWDLMIKDFYLLKNYEQKKKDLCIKFI